MARGENQGLQIALIIFVMVALVLGVSTFYFFQKYDEQRQVIGEATRAAEVANQKAQDAEAERDTLKEYIGHPRTAGMDLVKKGLDDSMKQYASSLPDAQKNYLQALALQDQSFQQKNAMVDDEKVKVSALEARNEEREKVKQPQIDTANQNQAKAQSDLKNEQDKYTQVITKVQQDKDSIANEWNAKQQELNDIVKKARTEVTVLKSELGTAKNDIASVGTELQKYTATTSTVPDGRVVWVDQRTQTAWINLGSADNLPRQQTFSVHPAGITTMREDGETTTRKASAEVTRVTGAHMAEVRILDYDLNDPVVAGDKLFTPVWHPGRKNHFAIVGSIHVNNDGTEDRAFLKDVIGQAGGVVDLELLPDASTIGPGISLNTTYLIRGEIPKSTDANDAAASKVAKLMSEIENNARNHGARVITVQQFLDDMGYTNRERIFRSGMGDDFTASQGTKPGQPTFSRGSSSDLFRKRSAPPSAY